MIDERLGRFVEISQSRREAPNPQLRQPSSKSSDAKFGLDPALGSEEFMPFINNDTFQMRKFLSGIGIGEKERK
jgi:hypothetical protein